MQLGLKGKHVCGKIDLSYFLIFYVVVLFSVGGHAAQPRSTDERLIQGPEGLYRVEGTMSLGPKCKDIPDLPNWRGYVEISDGAPGYAVRLEIGCGNKIHAHCTATVPNGSQTARCQTRMVRIGGLYGRLICRASVSKGKLEPSAYKNRCSQSRK